MKNFAYLLLFLLVMGATACSDEPLDAAKYDVLISHVNDQKTYEGARSMFFVHAIHSELSDVLFSLQGAPKFVKVTAKNGQAIIQIDAPVGAAGKYEFNLIVEKGTKETIQPIWLTVKKLPANTFYIDNANGNDQNDGSSTSPWKTLKPLQKQLSSTTKTLVLFKNGHYEQLPLTGTFKNNVTLMPLTENDVSVGQVNFASAKNITIAGLNIQGGNSSKAHPFVAIDSMTSQITVTNCQIGDTYLAEKGTLADWKDKSRNGIFSRGKRINIYNNLITCTFHGLETKDTGCKVRYNIIDRFGGDAIRNTAGDNLFEFNTLKNAVIADYSDPHGNHDDLYQSWTFDKPIKNVILRNNIAIAYDDKNLKFPSKVVQGLVCFDGFAENWTITGNLVLVDHPHGITLLGANNCKITGNTVIRNPLHRHDFESEPWIMVEHHKDGRSGHDNIVKDNIVSVLKTGKDEAAVENNTITGQKYDDFFIDYKNWNFTIKND